MARGETRRPDAGGRQTQSRRGGRRGEEPEPDPVEEAPVKSRKGLWIILSLVGFLVLGGGGAAAYFFVFADSEAMSRMAGGEGRDGAEPVRQPPIYYSLDPPFVNNLAGTGGRRFMQVTVQLMARDPAVIAAVQRHEPVVRNDLIMLFSDQTLDSIDSTAGKEALRRDSLDAIRRILRQNDEPAEVEDLFFTSFIVQ